MPTNDFASELIRGLVYAHNRANANTAEIHRACVMVDALAGLLVECGLLEPGALEARQQATAEGLRRQYLERGMAVAMQEFGTSKYRFEGGAEVDCRDRVHLCRAACCRIPLALSGEDVREGVVSWDLGQPYIIARDLDGYCVHLGRKSHRCTVYDQRPIPCRGYDCRDDERVWLDFEAQVLHPCLHEPDWPACLEVERTTSEEMT